MSNLRLDGIAEVGVMLSSKGILSKLKEHTRFESGFFRSPSGPNLYAYDDGVE